MGGMGPGGGSINAFTSYDRWELTEHKRLVEEKFKELNARIIYLENLVDLLGYQVKELLTKE